MGSTITAEEARRAFVYDSGRLFRRKTGARAGGITGLGYESVSFKRRKYQVHRIVYLLVHGQWPKFVDHINGDKLDNRAENLRDASKSENARNVGVSGRSSTGVKNVTYDAKRGKYHVKLRTDGGRQVFLGRFDTIDAAAKAATKGREMFHGEFANHGA